MTRLTVVVYGLPAPQGSKRHVGNGVMVESSKAVKPWREDVKLAALRALEANPDWDPSYALVSAHITFSLPRPRSHFRTGKYANELRPNVPSLVGKKPDLDKLLRSTFDALGTAGAYTDDSRLAQVFAVKVYASAVIPGAMSVPGARIELAGGTR